MTCDTAIAYQTQVSALVAIFSGASLDLTFCNEAFRDFYGAENGNSLASLLSDDTVARLHEACEKAQATSSVIPIRGVQAISHSPSSTTVSPPVRCTDGMIQPLAAEKTGDPFFLLTLWQEATDKPQKEFPRVNFLEQEIGSSDREISESIPGMSFTSTPDGDYESVSEQWVDYTGVPSEQQLGERWTQVLHPEDRENAICAWQQAVKTEGNYDFEYRVKRFDGEYQWFKVRGRPIRNSLGEIIRWHGTALNINDLKESEERLRKSKARLRSEQIALSRLHQASTRLWRMTDLKSGLNEILSFAAEILAADMGCIRLLEHGGLQMAASQGFSNEFLAEFKEIALGVDSPCTRALRMGERVTIPDITTTKPAPLFRDMATAAGFQAVYVTPLITRQGKELGTLATYFVHPRYSSEAELHRFDLYVRQVIDFIERCEREQALRESEERFRVLVESSSQAVWETTADGLIIRDSPSWRNYTGQSLREWLGYGWLDAVHPLDHQGAAHAWQQALTDSRKLDIEVRLLTPDKGYRWAQIQIAPVLAPEGTLQKWVGMSIDITGRKTAETALRESEERYRTLFETIDEGFCTLEIINDSRGEPIDYRLLKTNPAFERQTGIENGRGKRMKELVLEHEQSWFETYCRVARTGIPIRFESKAIRLNRWFDIYAWRYGDPKERTVGVLFNDITERKKYELALEESEKRLRAFLKTTSEIVYRTNADWSEMQQLDGCQFLSMGDEAESGWLEKYVPSPDQKIVSQAIQEAIAHQSLFELEHRVIRSDGSIGWIYSRAIPIISASGQILEWFGAASDITSRKQAETQMQMVMAELNHRVKNTLAVVNSVAQQTIRRSPDLQTFAKSFLKRLQSIAKAHSLLTSTDWKGAELVDIIHNELDSRIASTDQLFVIGPHILMKPKSALAMHMIVHELTTNAAKYGALKNPDGRVEIIWGFVRHNKERWISFHWKETCSFEVSPPEEDGYGTKLVQQSARYDLQGEIEQSYHQYGLEVSITFPLSGIASTTLPQKSEVTGEKSESVLVVEDNALVAMNLTEDLYELGAGVIGPARSLEEGVRLLDKEAPSAALLDVDLAGTKVYPLARRLKQAGVPYVLITGYDLRDIPEDLRKSPILSKPVSRSQVKRFLSQLDNAGDLLKDEATNPLH